MIVATTPFIAGHRVTETKGQVFGLVVRSRGFSGNLIAGLRSLGGGEIKEYTSLLEDTRRQALDRLVKNATLMGGNAVISMRFDSSEMATTMTEIVAYGTARRDRRRRRRRQRRRPSSVTGGELLSRRPRAIAVAARRRSHLLIAGLGLIAIGARSPASPASGLTIVGAVLSSPSSIERQRYRSEEADRSFEPVGPGGGEPTGSARAAVPPDRRDVRRPDDGVTMRVYVDRRTGERRYVADADGLRGTPSRIRKRPRAILAGPTPGAPGCRAGNRSWSDTAPMTAVDPTVTSARHARDRDPDARAREPSRRARAPYINRELSWLEYSAPRPLRGARRPQPAHRASQAS